MSIFNILSSWILEWWCLGRLILSHLQELYIYYNVRDLRFYVFLLVLIVTIVAGLYELSRAKHCLTFYNIDRGNKLSRNIYTMYIRKYMRCQGKAILSYVNLLWSLWDVNSSRLVLVTNDASLLSSRRAGNCVNIHQSSEIIICLITNVFIKYE